MDKEDVQLLVTKSLHGNPDDKVINLFLKLTQKAEQMERERVNKENRAAGDPRLGEYDDVEVKGTPEFEDIVKKDWGFDWWRKAGFEGDHTVLTREIRRTN